MLGRVLEDGKGEVCANLPAPIFRAGAPPHGRPHGRGAVRMGPRHAVSQWYTAFDGGRWPRAGASVLVKAAPWRSRELRESL